MIAVGLMGLVLLGIRPFDVETGDFGAVVGTILGASVWLVTITISFLKGRIVHGTFGFFINPLAIYAALRLGKPSSCGRSASTASATPVSRSAPSSASIRDGAPTASRTA